MFVLRNVGRYIFGAGAQEALIELPQGQLYLVRPLSPKGYSELIFKDSAVRIRRTNQEFQYQLVVQRVFEEGEAELLAEEEGEDAEIDALAAERDEKTFLLDEALHLRVEIREGGEKVLAWRDLSGDNGDLFEFVCDSSVASSQVEQFLRVAQECQYERKYRKANTTASEEDLQQFEFDQEAPIPPASPLHSPALTRSSESVDDLMKKHMANTAAKRTAQHDATNPPLPVTVYASLPAELHAFDGQAEFFKLIDDGVTAVVSEVGKWQYWLQVEGTGKPLVGAYINETMSPMYDYDHLAATFNLFLSDGTGKTYLLRFKDDNQLSVFHDAFERANYERVNQVKWAKVSAEDQNYLLDSMKDLTMEDAPPLEEEEEEVEEEDDTEDGSVLNEEYDTDEEYDGTEAPEKDGDVNSQLAVGYKNDRSFVVRGNKIGVFKHTPKNHLEFSTNISKITTPGGKVMKPKKVMLHSEDRNLVMQGDKDPNKLYRMDLEYGKVVDEWKVHDDIPVVAFGPDKKFAQMTAEQTFLGASSNSLFRIDPRLPGNKLVDSDHKQYASKHNFSSLATTEKGYMAVANTKGEIRLFDRLGIRAKTSLPGLGDPILFSCTSADGRYGLFTTQKYLLLVDFEQKEGTNAGKLGFEKSFSANSKPIPKKLTIKPEHVAQIFHETGKGIDFKAASFNTGMDTEETSISTATGPYLIDWNLKKVLRGVKDAYRIRRHQEDIVADSYKYGSDRNLIVALPNQVDMVTKQSLKKPTRESIIGNARLSTPRRSSGRIGNKDSGRYKLGRDDIVDSPY